MGRICFWTLLSLALFAAPATAQGSFTALGSITGPGPNALEPKVGVDAGGSSVFTWRTRDGAQGCGGSGCFRVRTRARSAAGVLTATQTVSPPGENVDDPGVAVDPDGDAVFVWMASDQPPGGCGPPSFRVEARARAADGTLGAGQLISESAVNVCRGETPKVAIDAGGNAVFVWRRLLAGSTGCGGSGCIRVQTRTRRADGTLTSIRTLSPPGQDGEDPQVAVDGRGNAVFVWQRGFRIETRTRVADGTLSTVETVSPPLQRGVDVPDLAVNASGAAVFAWKFDDPTTDCFGHPCSRIQIRARAPSGALGPAQVLSGTTVFRPEAAIDGGGNAVFVWEGYDDTNGCLGMACKRIQARARAANGALSATQMLSAPGEHAEFPHVAMDSRGNAVFVWQRPDGTTGCPPSDSGCFRVQARSRTAEGTLSPTQTLSAPGRSAAQGTVAVDPDGGADPKAADAVAVWIRPDETTDFYRVQAAVQIAPGPF
jgi:hypothetical protein